ncbi:hypothetical protein GGR53DRAFT_530799 [Hypoxylon sp. FL1150]|nr:hypothetical protein GGR53DRAFT_530799 [Hypoxylon sp. FL1150]
MAPTPLMFKKNLPKVSNLPAWATSQEKKISDFKRDINSAQTGNTDIARELGEKHINSSRVSDLARRTKEVGVTIRDELMQLQLVENAIGPDLDTLERVDETRPDYPKAQAAEMVNKKDLLKHFLHLFGDFALLQGISQEHKVELFDAQQEIAQLRIAALEGEVAKAKSTQIDFSKFVARSDLDRANEDLAKAKEKLGVLRVDKGELNTQVTYLKEKVKAISAREQTTRQLMDNSVASEEALRAKADELDSELQEAVSNYSFLEDEYRKLSTTYQAQEEEIMNLNDRISDMRTEGSQQGHIQEETARKLTDRAEEAEQTLEIAKSQHREEIRQLEKEIDRQKKKAHEYKKLPLDIQRQLSICEDQLSRSVIASEKHATDIEIAKEDLRQEQIIRNKLQLKLDQTEGEHFQLIRTDELHRMENRTLTAERDALKTALEDEKREREAEREKEKKERADEVRGLREKLTSCSSQVESLTKRTKDCKEELEKQKTLHKSVNDHLDMALSNVTNLRSERDEAEGSLEKLRRMLSSKTEEMTRTTWERDHAESEKVTALSERDAAIAERVKIQRESDTNLADVRREAAYASRRDKEHIEDLQKERASSLVLEKQQLVICQWKPGSQVSLSDSWLSVMDSIAGSSYIAPPTVNVDADALNPWTVAQPWRVTIPFSNSVAPSGSSITSLLIQLYRRISTGQLDGLAFQLLELITKRSALTEGKGGEPFLDGPLRLLLGETLRVIPPTQNIDSEVFCFGLDKLASFLQSTRDISLPESEQLRGMLQQCASYETLRDIAAGREEAESYCLDKGITGNGYGLIKVRRDRIVLVVKLEDLSLRLVDSDLSDFRGDDHGVFRSPLGQDDDIVVEMAGGVHLAWWFRVTT